MSSPITPVNGIDSSQALFAALFLMSLWFFRAVFDLFHCGPVGQVLVGILFVALPSVPLFPGVDGIACIGQIGIVIIALYGGLSVSVSGLRQVGLRAFFVALLSSVLPMGAGIGILHAMGFKMLESVASGAALSSTSVAMAIKLMTEHGIESTTIGMLITTASMIEDIFSMILLAIVAGVPPLDPSTPSDEPSTSPYEDLPPDFTPPTDPSATSDLLWAVFRPILANIGVISLGLITSVIMPRFLRRMDDLFLSTGKVTQRRFDRAVLVFLMSVAYATSVCSEWAGSARGLGVFMAGVAFSGYPACKRLWKSHLSTTVNVLLSFFFASIGFYVPIPSLFVGRLVGYGFLLALAAAASKLLVMFLIYPLKQGLLVGISMVTRGELGMLIATLAIARGLVSNEAFVVIVWALMLNTLIPTFFFGKVITMIKPELVSSDSLQTSTESLPS